MRNKVYVGLVHYPVYNKEGRVVETSVTNLDIHDISRSCRTYDVKEYFLIVPSPAQQMLTKRIISHWTQGVGEAYNADRAQAFTRTQCVDTLEDAIYKITETEGVRPIIITTSAKKGEEIASFSEISKVIFEGEKPVFILFGTGWGLLEQVVDLSDFLLEPIRGDAEFNHLSVRSAVAIILDRLLGEK
ncbi:MAG: RNA methyltransferase [Fusobacteria bacterium]|nr:RNA methyltransferase [Fusobacteriota bacterium]